MIIRQASEGKYLTNGQAYSECIYAPDNYNPADWWEVDEIVEDIEVTYDKAFEELIRVMEGD